jgi:hypothetical protein
MGILDWFKRPPPIDDRPALLEFIDSRAAFLTQKGIFDFSRAAAGPSFSQLIKEPAFAEAVDEARWKSYPLTLFCVVEMADGVMRPMATGAMPLAEALQAAAFEIIDRYPTPKSIDPAAWAEARAALGLRIIHVALHPPKYVKDIPLQIASQFHDNLPIHERLRGSASEIVTNNLRTGLIRVHKEFTERADCAALVAALGVASPARAPQPTV